MVNRSRAALRIYLIALVVITSFSFSQTAGASGGHFTFAGGDGWQRTQVERALAVSQFNWSLVQETVTIHIERGVTSHSLAGEIWLDSDLLQSGEFSWATVQDEYAAQVDYFLFTSQIRARLTHALGAQSWCYENPEIQEHSAQGCELFSSVLPWAYWRADANAYRPTSSEDESAAMRPRAFRRLLASLLGRRTTSR